MGNYSEVGFDADIPSGKANKYKARVGHMDRIGFPYPKVAKAPTHFIQEGKKTIICTDGICCEKLGPPKVKIGTAIIQYETNKLGKPNIVNGGCAYEVKVWIYNSQKHEQLKSIHEELPLDSNDVKIQCTDEIFQTMTITGCVGAVWSKLPDRDKIVRDAKLAFENIYLGQKLDDSELRELLGVADISSGSGSDSTSDQDLDSLINSLGA